MSTMARETPVGGINPRTAPEHRRTFLVALVATLLVKILLAGTFPITTDEAYFTTWGRQFDLGYYDHPPMVGWLLYLLFSFFGDHLLVARLPAILWSTLIGIGIYALIRPYDRSKAYLAATLYLISPFSLVGILITNDTPLALFSFASAAVLFKAIQRNKLSYYVLSGILLGLAFLSKYFAVLLAISYAVYFLVSDRSREKLVGFLALYAASIPFVLINVYWNYTHCWDNIVFNLVTRNQDIAFSPWRFLTYVVMLVYLMLPPVVYYLIRHRRALTARVTDWNLQLFACAFLVPILLLAMLATARDIGLHWLLSFIPFLFPILSAVLTGTELVKATKFTFYFSAVHVLLVAVLVLIPRQYLATQDFYDSMVFVEESGQIQDHLRPYESEFHLATDRYSTASLISYLSGKHFFVFGRGTSYGRQFDITTDFRNLDGRDILIFWLARPQPDKYVPFFESVELKELEIKGVKFYFVLGRGFRYRSYRANVLQDVKAAYYRIPEYLPRGGCYFDDWYFRTD